MCAQQVGRRFESVQAVHLVQFTARCRLGAARLIGQVALALHQQSPNA